MLIGQLRPALWMSVGCTGIALAIFGAAKSHFTGVSAWRSALQTVLIGGLASATAFLLAHWIGGGSS
jgi:VIT1/CCC1 family predicted Fe2+/Mn2+ transporter